MSQPWKWYVYILECADDTYYTGCTWDVPRRFDQHRQGLGSRYTSRHGARRVVYVEEFEDLAAARAREIQVKDWSQVKKRKLISGQWGPDW